MKKLVEEFPKVIGVIVLHSPENKDTQESHTILDTVPGDSREEVIEETKVRMGDLKDEHLDGKQFGSGASKITFRLYEEISSQVK
jgi:hypothetical protein